ncbi:hypothetical protein Tco_1333948 [Tanacetum coccineum]
MTSFDYRLNPIYAIKECSTCGVLYTADFCCSNKGLEDKILVPKSPRNCARCERCGTPVDGPYCQGCALLRKKFKEDLFTYCVENEFFKDLQDTSESSKTIPNVFRGSRRIFPGVGGIDTNILLTIKDDILREKLLNVNLLIANIEALKDNPAPSSDVMTKSSSTSLNLFLEETNTFDNSSPEAETFCFDLEEISSGSTTTRSDYSLPDYEAFYVDNDYFKERSSGSTTTHADFSQYDSFIFDLSNDQFPPTDRSDLNYEEFADELAHIISPSKYDHLCFKIEPELGNLTMDMVEDIYPPREQRVHVPNVLPTHTTLDTDFILLSEPLFAYIVWIFLPFLRYPVAPPYLLSCGNEDIIFDPDISIYHSFMPGLSHRSGTFMKFNVYPNHLNESPMEILSSTCSPMD